MKIYVRIFVVIFVSCFSLLSVAETAGKSSGIPESAGKKWRVGYYEGGEYVDYQHELLATVRALMDSGWLDKKPIPKKALSSSRGLWNWLGESQSSSPITFVSDAYYSSDWDAEARKKNRVSILSRLNKRKDIDLVLAMGTWAGKDLASNDHSTPVFVISASDPLSAGIIKSLDDSGYEHVHATVDPFRYERQIKVFHELVGFRKLGVAYEDTVIGRSYAAIEIVENVAKEKGFEVVKCYTESDIKDISLAERSVLDCIDSLSENVDALYITNQGGVNDSSLPRIVNKGIDYKIPTFSQSGSREVSKGILFSLSRAGFKYLGSFHASNMIDYFNGSRVSDISQVFEEPLKIAINLKAAELVGYDPPLLLLGAADEIFREFE